MSSRIACFVLGLIALLPAGAAAQDTPLSEILVHLIQSDVRLAPPPPGFPSHEAHFLPGEDQKLAPYLFNQAIVSQLSSFPVGSSAGGFSYTFDPALGTYARSTNSFGPSFAERAVTIGRHRWNLGSNFQHASYRTFEGQDIRNGDIKFYLTHQYISGQFFEGDLVSAALSMKLSTDTYVLFANYGITDRLDLGVSVPIVHVNLQADILATILRLATGDTGPTSLIHSFPGGGTTATFSDGGSATGIGDVLIRSKYQIARAPGGGLAGALEVRAPTGDSKNLLGTGATQVKILAIGSRAYGMASPHFNIGYTFSGKSSNQFFNVTDEFNYVGGLELAPSPKVTVAADLIGRQLRNSGRLALQPRTFDWHTQAGVAGSSTFDEFTSVSGSLNLLLGSIGVRVNPVSNLLVSGNVLFPMTNAGIRSGPVPVVGVEYAF
jgi:hypothetical protein